MQHRYIAELQVAKLFVSVGLFACMGEIAKMFGAPMGDTELFRLVVHDFLNLLLHMHNADHQIIIY